MGSFRLVFLMVCISIPVLAHALPMEYTPDPEPGTTWTEPTTGMEFVWIPAGCFIMGSNSTQAPYDEKPAHKVCLDGFWMGRFEVTNAEYRKFKPPHDSGRLLGLSLNGDRQPVVNATWIDARLFANWLSKNNGSFFELPTEAQWEYAALAGAGAETYYGETYYGKESPCLHGNFRDQSYDRRKPTRGTLDCDDGHAVTAPVGNYRPNPFGLYDMLGNALEMCLDAGHAGAYRTHARRNPLDVALDGDGRVARGGCYVCGMSHPDGKTRLGVTIDVASPDAGFRLVREK